MGISHAKPGEIRVVVADDHEAFRKALVMAIELYGELDVVGQASNGTEAVQLCRQLHPDVMVLDFMMPDMNGLMAAQQIHKDNSAVRIFIMTGLDTENHDAFRQKATTASAVTVLSKDVLLSTLLEEIRRA